MKAPITKEQVSFRGTKHVIYTTTNIKMSLRKFYDREIIDDSNISCWIKYMIHKIF